MRFFFSGSSTSYSTKEMLVNDGEIIESDEVQINLFPNPVESFLNIEYSTKNENTPVEVNIYSLMGEKIFTHKATAEHSGLNNTKIDFAAGEKYAEVP